MNKFLDKNRVVIATMLMLSAVFAFGDEFSGVNDVVQHADASASSAVRTGLKWLVGLLPFLLFAVGLFMGLKHSKRQADQDNENSKIFVTMLIGGVIGAIVGIAVDALIGVALLGAADEGIKMLTDFWKGTGGSGNVTTP